MFYIFWYTNITQIHYIFVKKIDVDLSNKKIKRVLVINSSARILRSNSRKLADTFVKNWKKKYVDSEFHFRELGNEFIPHITEEWINAAFKLRENRTQQENKSLEVSDIYINELKKADVIIVASPMYNWSIPSSLKAFIDQIVRVNETWSYNSANIKDPYIGLLVGKMVILLLTRGSEGYENGDYNENINYQTGYLRRVFNVMGISNIHVITVDGESNSKAIHNNNMKIAQQKIIKLIEANI